MTESFISLTMGRQRRDTLSLTGFTLVELIVVVIILGILLVVSAQQGFRVERLKESALDREVKVNLKLIKAAEKIYRMELNKYIDCVNTAEVNTKLKLSLPTTSPNWEYKVEVSPLTPAFTGKALRTANDKRAWCITQATEEPYKSGGVPVCTY